MQRQSNFGRIALRLSGHWRVWKINEAVSLSMSEAGPKNLFLPHFLSPTQSCVLRWKNSLFNE